MKLIFRKILKPLISSLHKFRFQQSGVAAVEFALIFPFMLLAYVGVVEVTQLYAADRKALILSRTLADLATQSPDDSTGYPTINDAQLALVFSLSTAVLYPTDPTNTAMRLTLFAFDSKVPVIGGSKIATTLTKAFVDWSETCTVQANGTCAMGPSPKFDQANTRCYEEQVPLGVAGPNSYQIRAEVSFHYKPILAGLLSSSDGSYQGLFSFMPKDGVVMTNTLFMRPRSPQSGNNSVIVRKYADGKSTLTLSDGTTKNDVATKCASVFKP
jgi:Flp pilus assembly protein TadG